MSVAIVKIYMDDGTLFDEVEVTIEDYTSSQICRVVQHVVEDID